MRGKTMKLYDDLTEVLSTLPTFHFNVNKDSGTGRFSLNDILKHL